MARDAPREARLLPFVGPLLVGYLVVELLTTAAALDGVSVALLVVAALGALSPRWFLAASALRPLRGALVQDGDGGGTVGRRRLSWLGLTCAAVAVARAATGEPDDVGSALLETVGSIAAPWVGVLAFDLALVTPDRLGRAQPGRPRDGLGIARALAYAGAVLVSLMEIARTAPALEVGGLGLVLVPHSAGWVTVLYVTLATAAASAARAARRRLGSEPEALAANDWALAGLVASLVVGVIALAVKTGGGGEQAPSLRGLVPTALAPTPPGPLAVRDSAGPVRAARTLRALVASLGALTVAALLAASFQGGALAHASWVDWAIRGVGVALAFAASFAFLRTLVERALAPDGGRLLEALGSVRERVGRASSLDGVAEAVLPPLREAARDVAAAPRLFVVDPAREVSIDAAGLAHVERRGPSSAIIERLLDRPGEVLLAAPVAAGAVRKPETRALVSALTELDALVVVPLTANGSGSDGLEGALIVARGTRTDAVTLEEIAELEMLGRELGVRVAAWSAAERAQERAGRALLDIRRLEEKAAALEDELADRGSRTGEPAPPRLFAYASSSRAALKAIEDAAPRDTPLLLVAEAGTPAEPWARRAHERGPRAEQPLVWLDCAEGTDAAIEARLPEALREAGRGTLVLLDVLALPLTAQSLLAEAIATRTVQIGSEAHPLRGRVIATARRTLEAAPGRLAFDPELARRLTPQTIHVPPLGDRLEDVRSIVLAAIERACRRGGRELLGIEEDALRWLEAHATGDGERGLVRAIERSVELANGPRIRVADAERALAGPGQNIGEDPLDATLAEVEERALLRALSRAQGNKSEAARLLGLKRTTFLDKIRRLGIDDGSERPSA